MSWPAMRSDSSQSATSVAVAFSVVGSGTSRSFEDVPVEVWVPRPGIGREPVAEGPFDVGRAVEVVLDDLVLFPLPLDAFDRSRAGSAGSHPSERCTATTTPTPPADLTNLDWYTGLHATRVLDDLATWQSTGDARATGHPWTLRPRRRHRAHPHHRHQAESIRQSRS